MTSFMSVPLRLGPHVQQLDLVRCHANRIGEIRDDIAGRHEMGVNTRRKCNGAPKYLASRSEAEGNQHLVVLLHSSISMTDTPSARARLLITPAVGSSSHLLLEVMPVSR